MKKLSNHLSLLMKIFILFSIPVLTIVLSFFLKLRYRVITAGIAFIISIFLLRKVKFEKISNLEKGIIFLISSYIDKLLITNYSFRLPKAVKLIFKYTGIKLSINTAYLLISIFIIFAIIFYVYLFIKHIYPLIIKFFKNMTSIEKRYLTTILILSIIVCGIVCFKTTAFGNSGPKYDYDIIYTSDSSYLTKYDAWIRISNLENDIRQPLFGVFALPFSITAHFLSDVLFFVPSKFSYEYVMMVMQFVILGVSVILLTRLIENKEKRKKYVYLLFSFSFPYLLFGFVLEQYVIGLFYLVLTIYSYFTYKDQLNYAYLGAVGTLITSGALFFLITKWQGIKDYIIKALKLLLIFLIIMILTGQFVLLFDAVDRFNFLLRFAGEKLPFMDRFTQYTYFVRSLFIAPKGYFALDSTKAVYHVGYRLVSVSHISIIGIITLGLSLISLLINRKDKMAWLSAFWIVLSFIVLCVVGWGTIENGLILYSLYFSWAFYILFYKLFKKFKPLIVPIILVFLIINSIELYNILKFAFTYYVR